MLNLAAALALALIAALCRKETLGGAKHAVMEVFLTETCQSLLMGNERQKISIGYRDLQSTFS